MDLSILTRSPHAAMLSTLLRSSHGPKLLVLLVLFFLTGFYLFNSPTSYSSYLPDLDLPDLPTTHDVSQLYHSAVNGKQRVFIEEAMGNEIDGSFNNRTIVELCKSRTWTDGLIVKCDAPEGGVANVRNVVLNCVRYAIEAGATGFVIPQISVLISTEEQKPVSLAHFFDLEHFKSTLSIACPQITLYNHQNDLYNLPSTAKPITIAPGSLNQGPLLHETILTNPGNWSANFKKLLNISHPAPFTAAKPILVNFGTPLLQFPLSYDDPHLIPQFGRLLVFRSDVRRTAAAILYALSKKHSLGLEPGRISEGKFYGAHLRTGNDAKAAGWTGYEVQSANYIATAEHYKLPAIYVVCSSASSILAFSEKASNASIATETKELLLGGSDGQGEKGFEEDWKALQRMNWDVQLLVDYEVLLRSSIFGGLWESSFSWGVAMRRHVVAGGDGGWKGIGEKRKRSLENNIPGQALRSRDAASDFEQLAAAQRDISERRGHVVKKRSADLENMTPEELAAKKAADADLRKASADNINAPEGSPDYHVKVGDTSFKDGLSVIFGPKGEGERIRGSLWP